MSKGARLRRQKACGGKRKEGPIPKSFKKAAKGLRLTARPMADVGTDALEGVLDGKQHKDLEYLTMAFQNRVAFTIAYGRGDAAHPVTKTHLRDWCKDYYNVFGRALKNTVDSATPDMIVETGPGYWVMNGGIEGVPALMFRAHPSLYPVKGDLVMMIPTQNKVILTGSDDLNGLRAMMQEAESALVHPDYLSVYPLVITEDGWCGYELPEGHTLFESFSILKLRANVLDQNRQAWRLISHPRIHDYMCDAYIREHPQTGQLVTFAVVTRQACPAGVPEVDYVNMCETAGSGRLRMLAAGIPWNVFARELKNTITPCPVTPERFRLESFPSERQIRSLRRKSEDALWWRGTSREFPAGDESLKKADEFCNILSSARERRWEELGSPESFESIANGGLPMK